MDKLYAPWRNTYITNNRTHDDKKTDDSSCVFCSAFKRNDDEKHLILKRFASVAIVMNRYPYNAGHLMVLPLNHKADLVNLSLEESRELIEKATLSVEVLKVALRPQGFNIGINLGDAGGGGIPSHLHLHIVPRWQGDTNFLPIVAETKVISIDLKECYTILKQHFENAS